MLGELVYTKLKPDMKIEGFMNAVRYTTKLTQTTVFADRGSIVKYSKKAIAIGHSEH